MVDCLEYAVNKQNEIPRIIDFVFDKIFGKNTDNIPIFNKKMRSAEEILKDYGLK